MMVSSSALIEFYAGRAPDFRGRMIDDIWVMSLDELEYTHDYIQWLFPLRERSAVEPDVPVLDEAAIAAFASIELQRLLERSANVMATFYGFVISGSRLDFAPNAFERQAVWLRSGNHNFLRLTRIMKSLSMLWLPELAAGWFEILGRIYESKPAVVGQVTWRFWQDTPSAPPGFTLGPTARDRR